MTPKQEAAMRQLAAALGVPQQKQITKEQAGKVLAEALGAHAAGHHSHAQQAVYPKAPDKDTELAKLHSYLSGADDNTAREAAEQKRIDAAVAKALAAHGVTAGDNPGKGAAADEFYRAFLDAAARAAASTGTDEDQ